MVEVSQEAATVLKEVRKAYKIPGSAGLRFYADEESEAPPEQAEVMVTFADTPAEDDQIVEEGDTTLFIAPEVADRLEGASLSARAGPRPVLKIEYADA
jgi:Fe-S cluster assembly iron-binding protein IscA